MTKDFFFEFIFLTLSLPQCVCLCSLSFVLYVWIIHYKLYSNLKLKGQWSVSASDLHNFQTWSIILKVKHLIKKMCRSNSLHVSIQIVLYIERESDSFGIHQEVWNKLNEKRSAPASFCYHSDNFINYSQIDFWRSNES